MALLEMQQPLEWVLDRVSQLTWPVLTICAIKLTIRVMRFLQTVEDYHREPVRKINAMAEETLPDMQTSLTSIDKNIAILVDRGGRSSGRINGAIN